MKDVGGEWPLSVPLCTLSVLARLLVRRLCNLETGNDLLCVDIWQRCVCMRACVRACVHECMCGMFDLALHCLCTAS